jgi:hypothetical protein
LKQLKAEEGPIYVWRETGATEAPVRAAARGAHPEEDALARSRVASSERSLGLEFVQELSGFLL